MLSLHRAARISCAIHTCILSFIPGKQSVYVNRTSCYGFQLTLARSSLKVAVATIRGLDPRAHGVSTVR